MQPDLFTHSEARMTRWTLGGVLFGLFLAGMVILCWLIVWGAR